MKLAAIPLRLPWPTPALLGWLLAWLAWQSLRAVGLGDGAAFAGGLGVGMLAATWVQGRWRRVLVLAGFPLVVLAAGVAVPGWGWALAAAALLLAYPLRAWRDAPFFPTPDAALQGLAACVPLPPGARVLDAGCGLGHGLRALRQQYPQAQLEGVEWSWPLALLCRLRCRFARVRRGDMWREPWQGCALVYLFQRPESMARALAKAQAELAPGGWLVSLEFEAAGLAAHARLAAPDGRPVWIYRVAPKPGSTSPHAGR